MPQLLYAHILACSIVLRFGAMQSSSSVSKATYARHFLWCHMAALQSMLMCRWHQSLT